MEEITNLSSEEARDFFLKGESYCEFITPPYFEFEPLLDDVSEVLSGSNLSDFYRTVDSTNGDQTTLYPSQYDGVNFTILRNKDGRFAWRPFQIIHPALYVDLVNKITSDGSWDTIQERFSLFQQPETISPEGIPVRKSEEDKSDTASTVKKWWRSVELVSIELALEYEYIFHTDISDCYGSIYTHSISWALHTKSTSKSNKRNSSLLGNRLDWLLQDMSYGQTNGIPQGSRLMDFIAEIVLGYADLILFDKLNREDIRDYKIIRYRDDYRIYTNNPQQGEAILKCLTEVLHGLNMELSSEKTYSSDDVIQGSIKPDKMHWLLSKQKDKSLHKTLLILHELSKQFPNSGSLLRALDSFLDRLKKSPQNIRQPKVLISIVTDIAYSNPRIYHYYAAILSELLSHLEGTEDKKRVLENIREKFAKLPNTNHLSMWLQRITLCSEVDFDYSESICQKVVEPSTQIWNSDWLSDSLRDAVVGATIADEDKIEEMSPKIQSDEVKLFSSDYPL